MLGLWIGQIILLLLRIRGHQATSLPGKVALRFSPRLLERLGKQLEKCIVITGTNGKTTTTNLCSSIFQEQETLLSNLAGANLIQGLLTALLQHTTILGRLRRKMAIFEVDEATLPKVASLLPIQILVVTNVFRDQLDRYGELDTTVSKLLEGIRQTHATLILNGDDPLARHIGLQYTGQVLYFGMSEEMLTPAYRDQMRDGAFCLQCGHVLNYEGFVYGQLGFYRCSNCDFSRPLLHFTGSYRGSRFYLEEAHFPVQTFPLPVRGMFNVYNVLAAIACARAYGVTENAIERGLDAFQPPVGRMQVFPTEPTTVLNLIKNPTGCDSVLQAVCAEPERKILLVAINDLAADGRDVSWLWDADFELMAEQGAAVHCITSGKRAEDMAVRLKYAGFESHHIQIITDLQTALDEALIEGQRLGNLPIYVLTTYTLLHVAVDHLQKKEKLCETTTYHRASVS